MTIDDLKIDELEHVAEELFREVDLQFMRSLPVEKRIEYINGMLSTQYAQSRLALFRWEKLKAAVAEAFKGAAKVISDVFSGIAVRSLRRIGHE